MKLFAVYVGGLHPAAHIELHDMRFIVAETIEDTHEQLRHQWWGEPASLHIDGWAELSRADGYQISLKPEPSAHSEKLYYVNLGGYDPTQFTELHRNLFVVAQSPAKASARALRTVPQWNGRHRDNIYEAEQCFDLAGHAESHALHIHLEKITDDSPPPFTCRYWKIGRR